MAEVYDEQKLTFVNNDWLTHPTYINGKFLKTSKTNLKNTLNNKNNGNVGNMAKELN